MEIRQCTACGLVQLTIPPVTYYREVITATSFSEATRKTRLAQMQDFVRKFSLRGKLALDVGSNRGDMLDIMAEAGLVPIGLEASAASVAAGRAAERNLYQGYIGDGLPTAIPRPDAFVMLNYLEHLPFPGAIIRHLHAITAAEAAGYVTVPNLEYLLRTNCLYEFVPDHLSYFTRATLAHAFAANGFEVSDCYLINQENDIVAMVRKRPALSLTSQYAEVEELAKQLHALLETHAAAGRRIAVWGAGHRTLFLMSIARLSKLSYVVDSAPFKHGKYTPILHLPIVPPQTLLTDPVDLVLVMVPGLYPDEVLKTLRKMNVSANIVLLRDNKLDFVSDSSNSN